eukprot:gnl/Trimastix_PCT/1979.p2 GENE.gnl/Trimastix_PCT/1979~~gnl/Trimastix_PCT/1979.p2  ORF type:complete len:186 (+),score=43.63 gnl/Trimastix_PCT/1979:35-592(+)
MNLQRQGETAWQQAKKINSELFSLTYGALVTQVLKDYEDVEEVNRQLERIGYNIGIRLIDDFLARSNIQNCANFHETAEAIAKVAFRMFLGINVQVTNWNPEGTKCTLVIRENPLTDFVELPENCSTLSYCNILCGVITGALEMVNMRVECHFTRDILHGDDVTELRLCLRGMISEGTIDESYDA